MSTFDFSKLNQISQEIADSKKSNPRVTANSAAKINASFLALSDETKAAFEFTGWQYKECKSVVSHPDKKCLQPLDFFARTTPKTAADNFSTEKIAANLYFRCCVVALAAQNKGKIAIIDLVALYQHFNLGYFVDSHNKSTAAVASKIQFDLRREVIVKGEWLEIPNIEMTNDAAKFTAYANSAIAESKSKWAQPKSKVTAKR
jgi:hypothetical protein